MSDSSLHIQPSSIKVGIHFHWCVLLGHPDDTMIMMHLDQTNFVPPTWSGGYTAYRDSDSRVILDVDEEREAMRRAMEVAF